MRRRLVLTAATLLACVGNTYGQEDESSVEAMIEAFVQEREAVFAEHPDNMMEALQVAADGVFADADFRAMDIHELAELADSIAAGYLSRGYAETMLKRIAEIARDPEADAKERATAYALGASFDMAGMYSWEYVTPAWATLVQESLHDAFMESPQRFDVLQGEHGDVALEAMLRPGADGVLPSARIVAILDAIQGGYPVAAVNGPNMLWDYAKSLSERDTDALSEKDRERARLQCIAWAEAGVAHHQAKIDAGSEDEMDQRIVEYLASSVENLNSRAARGLLIGYPTPDLSIRWSSDESLTSLSDLEGKVVVLDFFATWCGPCIATFPQVSALREKYSEDELAIVMITSPQGAVYYLDPTPIDCDGDIEKEIGLMPRFIEHHEITWTMAVMGEGDEVFPPDFGVRGIPHVAILDAKGNVRFNGLHPTDPTKYEKIDQLLQEARSGG